MIACLKTEWFDVDDPCLVGDFESHFESIASVLRYKKTRRFRNCLPKDVLGEKNTLSVK